MSFAIFLIKKSKQLRFQNYGEIFLFFTNGRPLAIIGAAPPQLSFGGAAPCLQTRAMYIKLSQSKCRFVFLKTQYLYDRNSNIRRLNQARKM